MTDAAPEVTAFRLKVTWQVSISSALKLQFLGQSIARLEYMPFKSKGQRRKFAQLLVEGRITDQTYEEWNRETGRKELPERVDHPGRAVRLVRSAFEPTISTHDSRVSHDFSRT